MDITTYALLKKKVDNVTLAYTYKGSVATTADLPSGASKGDLYTVGGQQYVFDGTTWVQLDKVVPITNEQIDTLFVSGGN